MKDADSLFEPEMLGRFRFAINELVQPWLVPSVELQADGFIDLKVRLRGLLWRNELTLVLGKPCVDRAMNFDMREIRVDTECISSSFIHSSQFLFWFG